MDNSRRSIPRTAARPLRVDFVPRIVARRHVAVVVLVRVLCAARRNEADVFAFGEYLVAVGRSAKCWLVHGVSFHAWPMQMLGLVSKLPGVSSSLSAVFSSDGVTVPAAVPMTIFSEVEERRPGFPSAVSPSFAASARDMARQSP